MSREHSCVVPERLAAARPPVSTSPCSHEPGDRTPRCRFTLPVLLTVAVVTACLVGSLVTGCRHEPTESPEQPIAVWAQRDWSEFVGSDSCRECHAEICDRYQAHPMAQAMCLASSEAETIEDYAAGEVGFTTAGHLRYEVRRSGDDVWHTEQKLTDDDQSVKWEQSEPVLFAMGSGTRGRSYVLVENGRMFESPISWYTGTDQWDLSPGYPPQSHNRFNREIAGRCLLCHCGLPADTIGNGPDVFAYEPPFIREFGISCERCHGPAASHVEYHRQGARGSEDPIVNPARLDPARRDDVCNQCHLLGEDAVLRYGRRYDDFRPGDRLGDVWALFVRGTDVDSQGRTQAVSHVQQTHSSVCFKQSQGRLGCASCHDPHGVPSDKVAHYRDACFKCHAGPETCSEPLDQRLAVQPDDSCVACHMPSLAANDIPHTSQTDHRILRNPDTAPRHAISDIGSLEDWEVFGGEGLDWTPREQDRCLGIAWGNFAAASKDVVAARQAIDRLTPLLETFHDDAIMRDVLAYCSFMVGNRGEAEQFWQDAIRINPELPTARMSLGLLKFQQGLLGEAREHLLVYVEQKPRHVAMLQQLAEIESLLLNDAEALRWTERALEIEPGNAALQARLTELKGSSPAE